MHAAVVGFVWDAIETRDREGRRFCDVVEIGSRNVNGSVRSLFGNCRYTGIDFVDGPGVDIVADASLLIAGTCEGQADCVVCTNVLEHEENWRDVIRTCAWLLKPEGWLILTVPAHGFPRHSGLDGGQLRSWEHYGALEAADLEPAVEAAGLRCEWGTFTHEDSMIVASK